MLITSVFPVSPAVNLNLQTVYIIWMLCVVIKILTHLTSWKVMKLCFRTKLHNYIITISKLDSVWLPHWQGRRLFSGGKFLEVSIGRADGHSDLFSSQIQWVKVFCRWQALFFGQKCDEESVGQAGGWTLLHIQLWYFFPHISCQRQLQLLRYYRELAQDPRVQTALWMGLISGVHCDVDVEGSVSMQRQSIIKSLQLMLIVRYSYSKPSQSATIWVGAVNLAVQL